jgi:hypothetical protein
MPDGVLIGSPSESAHYFTKAKARKLTDEIRGNLEAAHVGLQLAAEGHAHLALGYSYFHEYCLAEFGDIKQMRLPVDVRRALVASMCDAGASVTDIVKAIGFSRGTVQGDRVALGISEAQPAGQVISLHEPEPVAPEGPVWVQALWHLARQEDRGLTLLELSAVTGWTEGKASGVLSRLCRKGMSVRSEMMRVDHRAYVVTDLGRETLDTVAQ